MIPVRNFRRVISKAARQPGYAARVALTRIRAAHYYARGRGQSPVPEALTLFLTHRCNLRCRMCGQWGDGGSARHHPGELLKEELTFDEMAGLIDEVSAFRPGITLFGGEPLLYRDCVRLVSHIKQKMMHCLMITNGALLVESAEGLVAGGLDELNVSLDGSRDLHDRIRGTPGLFDTVMRGLQEVRNIKRGSGRSRPLINLQCTITKYNYQRLEEMLDVAAQAGADSLTFHNLIFIDRDTLRKQKPFDVRLGCSSSAWEGFAFEPGIDAEALQIHLKDILSRKHPLSVDVYPDFSRRALLEYYRSGQCPPAGSPGRCLSPWLTAYLFPDGSLRPCLNSTYAYGNIKEGGFRRIWNSPRALRYRQELKKEGIFPVCSRCTELYRY